MIAAPGEIPGEDLHHAFAQAGANAPRIAEIGSHAARFDLARPARQ
jgi:hypothetical protein